MFPWIFACIWLSIYGALINGQFTGCDYSKAAVAGETFYISSPGYSNFYQSATNCRWAMTAPTGYTLYMNCYDMYLPSSSGCYYDRLEVSLTGRTDLADATKYCGGTPFIVQSKLNQMVVALRAPAGTLGGRMKCQVTALAPPCDCGRQKMIKIVGGVATTPNEFPMMAAIVDLVQKEVFCGATIISNQHALTAAHCLVVKALSNIALLVGEQDYSVSSDTQYTKLMLLSSFVIHQGYTAKPVSNDIAILRTRDPIVFTPGVGPACLPFNYASMTFLGATVQALGWGTIEFGGPVSKTLNKVDLNVIDTGTCASQLPTSNVTTSEICTFTQGKDSCQYDSGGPLMYVNPTTGVAYHVGIISYGVTCAASKPSVSTRITSYLDWIQQNTPGVGYCVR